MNTREWAALAVGMSAGLAVGFWLAMALIESIKEKSAWAKAIQKPEGGWVYEPIDHPAGK